jgi:hypothetical protein
MTPFSKPEQDLAFCCVQHGTLLPGSAVVARDRPVGTGEGALISEKRPANGTAMHRWR